MESKVNGLVLKAVEFKEKDKLVTLSTLEKGKVLVSAKGARGDKAKLKLASSPLCFGEYILTENHGKFIMTGCSVISVFFDSWNNPDKYISSMILIELLDKITVFDLPAPDLTLATVKGLLKIEEGKLYPPALALKTSLDLIDISGFTSPVNFYEENEEAKRLFSHFRLEYEEMEALDITEYDVMKSFRLFYDYLILHLEIKLNSILTYLKD